MDLIRKKRMESKADRKKVEQRRRSLLISNEPDSVTEAQSAADDTGESGCQLPARITQTFIHLQRSKMNELGSQYSRRSYWWIRQAANKIRDWFKTSQCWNEMECVRWQPGYYVTHLHETEISRLTASWAVRRPPGGNLLPTHGNAHVWISLCWM